MVVQTAAATSGKPKPRKTAFDPVWSFLLSDYSDSDHEEDDEEYPPRKKRVHWGRLPTRFDPSDDEEATETRDDDDESNYLYMVPKYSATAATVVLQSLLSFSDNEEPEEEVEEEEEGDDEVRGDDGNLLGRLFPSNGRDTKGGATESKSNDKNGGSQSEGKFLNFLFPGRDESTNDVGKGRQPKQDTSFLKSLFSSDDESRGGESRRDKASPADDESRDGIVSRLSIWSWTSDEEDDDDYSVDDDDDDDDDDSNKDSRRPLSVLRAAKRRFQSKNQRKMQSRAIDEDKSPDEDTQQAEYVPESALSWLIPTFTTTITNSSQKAVTGENDQTKEAQDLNDAKDQRRLFPLRGRSLSDIAEETDGESFSSRRSAGSRSTTESRRVFSRRSSSLPDDNDGGSISSRKSAGSRDASEPRRLFLRRSSSSLADDNDGGSVSSRRSGSSKDSRLFSGMRKSSSSLADENDGGSIESRRSMTSKESARVVDSVRKSPSSLQKDNKGVALSSVGSLPSAKKKPNPTLQKSTSSNVVETLQQPKVIEGILRNSKNSTQTSSPSLTKQAKPALSEKEEVHGRTRLSWKGSAESPHESAVEVEKRASAREITHQRRRSFLSHVKERKLLNWSTNRRRKKKSSSSEKKEMETTTVAHREQAPVETQPDQKESNVKPASALSDQVESKSLEQTNMMDLSQNQLVVISSTVGQSVVATTIESIGDDDQGPYDEVVPHEEQAIMNPDSDSKVLWRFQAPGIEEKEVEPPSTMCGVSGLSMSQPKSLTSAEVDQPRTPSREPFPHFQNLARNLVYFADALDLFAPFDIENPDDSETLTTAEDGSIASDIGEDDSLDGDEVQIFDCNARNQDKSLSLPVSDMMIETLKQEDSASTCDERMRPARNISRGGVSLPPSNHFRRCSEASDDVQSPSLDHRSMGAQPRQEHPVNEIRLKFQPETKEAFVSVSETAVSPRTAESARETPTANEISPPRHAGTDATISPLSRSGGATADELDDQLVQAYVLSIEECSLYDQPLAKTIPSSTEVASLWSDVDQTTRAQVKSAATESSDLWSVRSNDQTSNNIIKPFQSTRQIRLGLGDAKSAFASAATESLDVWSFRSDDAKPNEETDPFHNLINDVVSRDLTSQGTKIDGSESNKQVDWQWPALDDSVWQWPNQDYLQRATEAGDQKEFDEHEYLGDVYEFVAESVSSDEFDYFPASSSICSRITDDLTAAETVEGSTEKSDDLSQSKQRRSSASRAFLRKLGRRSHLAARRRQESSPDNISKIVCCNSKSRDSSLLGRDPSRSEDISVNFPAVRFVSDSPDSTGRQTPSKIANVITVSDFINGTLEDALPGPQMLYTYEYGSKQHIDVVYDQYGVSALELLRVRSHRRPPFLSYGSNEALIQVEASTVSPTDCEIRAGKRWGSKLVTLPTVPGVDFVGRIRQVGKSFSPRCGLSVGDRVISLTKSGGNSRYILAPDEKLVKVPDDVDAAEAVALAETYLSAFQASHMGQNGASRYTNTSLKGKAILVIGVLTNVGHAIVEVAKAGGATCVYGTCKQKQFKTLQELGVVPLAQETSKWTSLLKGSVDLILAVGDRVKEDVTLEYLDVLRAGGRVVFIGRRGDNDLELSLAEEPGSKKLICARNKSTMDKTRRIISYDVYQQWERFTERSKADLSHLLSLLQQHLLEPRVLDRIPLRKVVKAHELLDSKRLSGILVCEPWLKSKQRAMYM